MGTFKICPECGSNKVIFFDSNNDFCKDCRKWFPAVKEQEKVYCHECSKAGGADMPIYHGPPICKVRD